MVKTLVCYDNIDIITILLERQDLNDDNQIHFVYKNMDFYANGIQIEDDGITFTTEYGEVISEIKCGTDDSPFKPRLFFTFEHGTVYLELEKVIFTGLLENKNPFWL